MGRGAEITTEHPRVHLTQPIIIVNTSIPARQPLHTGHHWQVPNPAEFTILTLPLALLSVAENRRGVAENRRMHENNCKADGRFFQY